MSRIIKKTKVEKIEAKNVRWRKLRCLNEILKAEATVDHINTTSIV